MVIWNTKDYIQQANQQLNNPKHYKKIPSPVHPNVRGQLNHILESLQRNKILEEKQIEYHQRNLGTECSTYYPKFTSLTISGSKALAPLGDPLFQTVPVTPTTSQNL